MFAPKSRLRDNSARLGLPFADANPLMHRMTAVSTTPPPADRVLGFKELVALVAMLMALNALAIDSMLPALPAIGNALGVVEDNSRQWVVTAYLLGFGGAQLFYGPLADRFGRRPLLFVGVGLYVLFSFLAAMATSFETLLIARVLQGVGAASTRVLAVAIVRDCYGGRRMAQVMSLAFLVFLGVPVIAPSLGAAIVAFGPWRAIFAVLGVWGAAVLIWAMIRLPETLKPEDRLPIRFDRLMAAYRQTLTTRVAVGYMLGSTMLMGCLFGFINSSQQIFADVFRQEALFPIIFAVIASGIAAASLINAKLVERLGTRLLSHTALIGFTVLSAIHLTLTLTGFENIVTFTVMQTLVMFCFGFVAGNFGAMAMEPLGHIAGTASSVQGTVSSVIGALTGFYIGQHFDGSVTPMALGFTVCGAIAIGIVLWAEGGRLFRSRDLPSSSPEQG